MASKVAEPIAQFFLSEPLDRLWQRQWVSFPFSLPAGVCRSEELDIRSDWECNYCFSVDSVYADGSVKEATAYVFTGLEPGQSIRFEVVRDRKAGPPAWMSVIKGDGWLILASDRLEVRVPDGTKFLPPILGIRRIGGKWTSVSRFEGMPSICEVSALTDTSRLHKLVHTVRYRFDECEYILQVEITAHEDTVIVREEFDSVRSGCLVFDFYTNVEPECGHWRFHRAGRTRGAGKSGNVSYKIDYTEFGEHILQPFYHWHQDVGVWWAGYSSCGEYLGAFMMKPSEWENPEPNRARVRVGPGPRLDLRLPFCAGRRTWGILLCRTDDAQVEAPDAPCRMQSELVRCGENGLDRVKDMMLDWPAAVECAHPHLLYTPGDVPGMRERASTNPLFARILHNHPEKPGDSAGLYLATGDMGQARAAASQILGRLRAIVGEFLEGGYTKGSNVAISATRPIRTIAVAYDAVASSGAFTLEEREYCIRAFAFLGYCLADENYWPREDKGICRGNINFNSDHYTSLCVVAALLPGHPKQGEWMDYVERQMSLEFQRNVFPGGAWIEAPNYQGYTMHYLMVAMRVMQVNGFRDFSKDEAFRAAMDYLFRLQTPYDVRAHHHMLPTVGDTSSYFHSQSLQVIFAWAASLCRDDFEFAGRMMYAWERAGRMIIGGHDIGFGSGWCYALAFVDPSIPVVPPEPLKSERLLGYGVLLRDRFGHPDEDYFLFKAGAANQHFDSDEGSIHWYSHGKPLCLDYGSMYSPSIEQPWLQNTLAFNRRRIWSSAEVSDFASFEGADFVRAECTASSLQEVDSMPGMAHPPGWEDKPIEWEAYNIYWRREIFYVKGFGYVVMRDDIGDAGENVSTMWSLSVLAESAERDGNCVSFMGQQGVDLDVVFALLDDAEISVDEWGHTGVEPEQWLTEFEMARMDETQINLHVNGWPGASYLAVLFPHVRGMEKPDIEVIEANIIKVVCGGVEDLIFFCRAPRAITVGDVQFSGRVGLVRRRGGVISVYLMDGNRVRVGDVSIVTGSPSFVELDGGRARGETLGGARTCHIWWTAGREKPRLFMDGVPRELHFTYDASYALFSVESGRHVFELR